MTTITVTAQKSATFLFSESASRQALESPANVHCTVVNWLVHWHSSSTSVLELSTTSRTNKLRLGIAAPTMGAVAIDSDERFKQ